MVGFGMKTKGFLVSWMSKPEKENDQDFAKKLKSLDALRATLTELQESMRLYLDSWKAMSQASAAIAEGLVKLAGEDVTEGKASPLHDMAHLYQSTQRTIDEVIKTPAQRVAEDIVLRQTGALLARFPPIYQKVDRRRQLLGDLATTASKVRAAEAARNRDGFKDPTGAAAAQRQKLAAALETTDIVLNGLTQEVKADVRQLEKEREKMLVPQVSALVGCQAFFFRRSAASLERLSTALPYSAFALCRLVRPTAMAPARASSAPVHGSPGPFTLWAPPSSSSVGASVSLIPFSGTTERNGPSTASNRSVHDSSLLRVESSAPSSSSPTDVSLLDHVEGSVGSLGGTAAAPGNSKIGGMTDARMRPLLLSSPVLREGGLASAGWPGDADDEEVEEVTW